MSATHPPIRPPNQPEALHSRKNISTEGWKMLGTGRCSFPRPPRNPGLHEKSQRGSFGSPSRCTAGSPRVAIQLPDTICICGDPSSRLKAPEREGPVDNHLRVDRRIRTGIGRDSSATQDSRRCAGRCGGSRETARITRCRVCGEEWRRGDVGAAVAGSRLRRRPRQNRPKPPSLWRSCPSEWFGGAGAG